MTAIKPRYRAISTFQGIRLKFQQSTHVKLSVEFQGIMLKCQQLTHGTFGGKFVEIVPSDSTWCFKSKYSMKYHKTLLDQKIGEIHIFMKK